MNQCQLCNKKYARPEKLLEHVAKVHADAPKATAPEKGNTAQISKIGDNNCRFCNKKYARPEKLLEHVAKVHADAPTSTAPEKVPEIVTKGSTTALNAHAEMFKVGDFYECYSCNKKYKNFAKLDAHVREIHGSIVLYFNTIVFDQDIKAYLDGYRGNYSNYIVGYWAFPPTTDRYVSLWSEIVPDIKAYCNLLERFNPDAFDIKKSMSKYIEWDGISKVDDHVLFVWCSHMLMPVEYSKWIKQNYRCKSLRLYADQDDCNKNVPKSSEIDGLEKNISAHLIFRQRCIESQLSSKTLSSLDQCYKMIYQFNRFLNMGRPWPGGNYCPSMIIELIWHSLMTNCEKYKLWCRVTQGKLLPRCLEEYENNHDDRFEEFKKLFEQKYGSLMSINDLVRGQDQDIENEAHKRHKEALQNYEKFMKVQRQVNEKNMLKREEARRVEAEAERKRAEERRREYNAYAELHGKLEADRKFYVPRPSWDDGKC